jgi:hypothetical protein
VSTERSQEGYALLATLVVTVLAAVFASACVAAVSATQGVVGADRSGAIADQVVSRAVDRAGLELWRRPQHLAWSLDGGDGIAASAWRVVCAPETTTNAAAWPQVHLTLSATTPVAARRLNVVLELRAETAAQGLVIAHDIELTAPVSVTGGGLYSGGSIRGREWLTFAGPAGDGPGAGPPDGVHGDVWPAAGAHALGGIWAAGEEVHAVAPGDPVYAADTDVHTGAGPVEALTAPPDPAVLAGLLEIALSPGGALTGGVLDLARLPPATPAGDEASTAEGFAIVVPAGAGVPVRVEGERPASACPVVVVLEGDAVLGGPDVGASLGGALVVCGHLEVAGPSSIAGHLFAAHLTVDAPLTLHTPIDWRRRQLPGLSRSVVLAVGR